MVKLRGKIKRIFDSETFNTFEKRVVWLDNMSEQYPEVWSLECWNADCKMLDNYKVGDYITAYVDIKGKYWTKIDKEGVMNSLKLWNIEKDGKSFKKVD